MGPVLNHTTALDVEVHIAGYVYTHKNLTFYIMDCTPAPAAVFPWWIFAIIGPLLFFLLWCCWPCMSGKKKKTPEQKAAAQKAARDAIAEPLGVFHKFFMDGTPFIGGAKPSIADIRLAATLEFLAVIDYPFPAWAKTYMAAMEKSLGKAYAEPAADVRGYIAYVKSQKK